MSDSRTDPKVKYFPHVLSAINRGSTGCLRDDLFHLSCSTSYAVV